MTGLLDHLTVVEVASPLTEWCGRLFSQAGARVILVEPPAGAETRSYAPFLEGTGRSLHFEHYNTDKESVVLALDAAQDRDLFLRLVADADVLLEGWGPDSNAPLGLSDAALHEASAGLIHLAISPFGRGGPWASFAGSDLIHLALGGQMMMCGYDDQPASPPLAGAGNQAYHMAGTVGFICALARLQVPPASGRGGLIDLSVHEVCSSMTEIALPSFDYGVGVPTRRTGRHATAAGYTPPWQYRAGDGRYVNAQLLNVSPSAWEKLVEWMDEGGLADDLGDSAYYVPEIFQERAEHISTVLGRFIATKTADEICAGGQARGLIFCDINYPHELLADEHLAARGFWTEVDQGDGSTRTYPGSAFVCAEATVVPLRRAPHVGEYQAQVFGGESRR